MDQYIFGTHLQGQNNLITIEMHIIQNSMAKGKEAQANDFCCLQSTSDFRKPGYLLTSPHSFHKSPCENTGSS